MTLTSLKKKLFKVLPSKVEFGAVAGAILIGLGLGQVQPFKHQITSSHYTECIASPDVQFIGKLEMLEKMGQASDQDIEKAIRESNPNPNDLKNAMRVFEFYKKHKDDVNGPTVEAFIDCLNK